MHNSLDGVGVGVGVGEGVITHRSSVFSVTRGKWSVKCQLEYLYNAWFDVINIRSVLS